MRDQIVLCASGAIATSSHDVTHVASGKQLNCFLHALPLAAGESTARVKMPRDEAYVVMLHGVCAPRLLIYRRLSHGQEIPRYQYFSWYTVVVRRSFFSSDETRSGRISCVNRVAGASFPVERRKTAGELVARSGQETDKGRYSIHTVGVINTIHHERTHSVSLKFAAA
jgi:hypothetical protein